VGTLWGSGAWANVANSGGAGVIITGTVNVFGNPGFVNPAAENYHIGPGSAAIDAGVNAGVLTDIDNQPRPYLAPDLGADEYWPPGVLKYVYLPLVAKLTPAWTGVVVLNNGSCCIGGKAGVPLNIPATFSATSSLGPVTQIRTRQWGVNDCSTVSMDGITWEPFSTQKTFTFTPPINWVTVYVNAQFRDSQGTESPVYCDDIAVEGMP
jgi:hypothetical protein